MWEPHGSGDGLDGLLVRGVEVAVAQDYSDGAVALGIQRFEVDLDLLGVFGTCQRRSKVGQV
jgi:hypothetical protein